MPEFELPIDMTGGKASYAKAAEGDKPVFEYIASLPQQWLLAKERVRRNPPAPTKPPPPIPPKKRG